MPDERCFSIILMPLLSYLISSAMALLLIVSPLAKLPCVSNLHLQDAAFAVIAVLVVVLFLMQRRNFLRLMPAQVIILACMAVMGIAVVTDFGLGVQKAFQFCLYLLVFIAAGFFVREQRCKDIVLCGIGLGCLATIALCLWQLIWCDATPIGFFRNRNVLAGFLSGLVFVASSWIQSKLQRKIVASIICVALFAAATAVLPSSGWVSIFAGIAVLAFMRSGRAMAFNAALGMMLGLLLSVLLLPEYFSDQVANLAWLEPNHENISQRYIEWQAALKMIADNPVFGVGPGNYQLGIGRYYGLLPKLNTMERDVQNGWLVFSSSMGVAGLCMFVWLLWEAMRRGREYLRKEFSIGATGLVAALVAWIVANLFTNVLVRETGPIFMTVAGLLWGCVTNGREKTKADLGETSDGGKISGSWALPAWFWYAVVAVSIIVVAVNTTRIEGRQRTCITLEAENAVSIKAPMRVADDRMASGFKVLEIPRHVGRGWRGEAGGSAKIGFQIPVGGEYYLWLRTKWNNGCENAVYVSMDNNRRIVAGNDAVFAVWHWIRTGPFNLAAGSHNLQLSNHSDGIMIDKMELVNSASYEPFGYGKEISTFFDGFAGCDAQNDGSWRKVSGTWTVIPDSKENTHGTAGSFCQTGNKEALALVHHAKWRYCSIETSIMPVGSGPVGIVFSFVDEKNYGVVEWTASGSLPNQAIKVFQVCNGKKTLIGQAGDGYCKDAWHTVSIQCLGQNITVIIDSKKVLSEQGVSLQEGYAGLYTRNNECVYFDNFRVSNMVDQKSRSDEKSVVQAPGRREEIIDGDALFVEEVRIGQLGIPILLIYEKDRIDKPGPAIIELHGWGESKSRKQRRLAPRPARRGYIEIHLDLRGHGERPEPNFTDRCQKDFPKVAMYVISQTAEDISSIIDYLETRKDLRIGGIGITGYSMGGSVAVIALTLDERISAAAAVNGGNCDYLTANTNSLKVSFAKLQGWGTGLNGQPDDELKAWYLKYDPILHLDRFMNRPVMFFCNRDDRIVSPDSIIKLHEKLMTIYGADTNRFLLMVNTPDFLKGEKENIDPMVSHLPDMEKLHLVDDFLDKYLRKY